MKEQEEISEAFPEISESDFIVSLDYDEHDARMDVIDTLMNLCSAQYYYKNKKLLSKYEGIKWASRSYPEYAFLLNSIIDLYQENQDRIPVKMVDEVKKFKQLLIMEREKLI